MSRSSHYLVRHPLSLYGKFLGMTQLQARFYPPETYGRLFIQAVFGRKPLPVHGRNSVRFPAHSGRSHRTLLPKARGLCHHCPMPFLSSCLQSYHSSLHDAAADAWRQSALLPARFASARARSFAVIALICLSCCAWAGL